MNSQLSSLIYPFFMVSRPGVRAASKNIQVGIRAGKKNFASITPSNASSAGTSAQTPAPKSMDSQAMKGTDKRYPICELHLLGYIPQQVEFYSQFSRQAATHLSLPHSFYRLPRLIRRWTVLKSPFKYKKFQETFQRVTHRRCISIYNGNPDVVDKWIKYLNHNVPAGMGLKVVKYQYDGMDVVEKMDREAKQAIEEGKIPIELMQYVNTQKDVRGERDLVKELREQLMEMNLWKVEDKKSDKGDGPTKDDKST